MMHRIMGEVPGECRDGELRSITPSVAAAPRVIRNRVEGGCERGGGGHKFLRDDAGNLLAVALGHSRLVPVPVLVGRVALLEHRRPGCSVRSNARGDIAGPYAVNMRMYEATGSGAALITEQKANLADLFTPGEEVLAYTDAANAARQAAGILADPTRPIPAPTIGTQFWPRSVSTA